MKENNFFFFLKKVQNYVEIDCYIARLVILRISYLRNFYNLQK